MRVAYLDCAAGISGDMVLGALIDAGWPEQNLRELIARLKLGEVQLRVERVSKRGISATQVQILSSQHQPHRGLHDLSSLVTQADLPHTIQERAIAALQLLAEAESQVHGVPVEQIHFHEVGAVDTIVDIVGAVVGFDELQVDEIHSSALPWSRGTVKTEHGVLPVPPPAVARLLRELPVVGVDIEGETVTPTGATLSRILTKQFGTMPAMKVERVGYGAGTRDWPDRPNVLRLTIGESSAASALLVEQLLVLSCNIDDMNPQWYQPLMKLLNEGGALDVWLTPVQMKKNRPGTVVEVLCRGEDAQKLRDVLFRHSTTLGVRETSVTRHSLPREIQTLQTQYGSVRVKVAMLPDGSHKVSPEHDDCAARAAENNVTVSEVWLAAARAFDAESGR
ncbi:MAG TPA: nickel pincer cofactor biosynthesis protein LarC [Pyrinomonadaceae bacterium]|nr:nickel pincer cofactor biosynthesis protein LarC [Pyrinomonadaceae bacterium]